MHKFKRIILSAAVLSVIGSGGEVYALDNEYSNQLLKLNVDKSGDNDVNVTVYTSKPYKLKVTPVKRSNGEYVIFLPETYHSITAKPDVSSSGGAIDDVDVKLVPDTGSKGNNGYTKITVKTSKDINVNLDNRVINPDPVQEDDLSNLINGHDQPSAVAPAESKNRVRTTRKSSSHNVAYTQSITVKKHKERSADTDFLRGYLKKKPVVKAAQVQQPKKQVQHKPLVQVKTTNSVKIAEAQEKPVVASNPVAKQAIVSDPKQTPAKVINSTHQEPQQVQPLVSTNMPTVPTQPNSAPNYPVIIGGFLALLVAVKMFKKPKAVQSQTSLPPAYTPDYDDNVYKERDKSVNPILARLSQGLPERPTRFSNTAVEEDSQYYYNEPQQEEYYDDNSFFRNQSYDQYDSAQPAYDAYSDNSDSYYESDNSYRYNPEERDNLEYLTYIPQEETNTYAGYQSYDDAYEENYDYHQELGTQNADDEYQGHFQIQHDEELENTASSIDDIFDEFVLEHSEILEQTQQLISETPTDEYIDEYENVTPVERNSFSSYLEQEEKEIELPVEDFQEYEEVELSPVLLDTAVHIDDDIYVQEEESVQDSPEVIDGYEIAENRGFYLIQTDESKSLIGVIGSEVFLLNSFSSEEKLKLAIKKSEKKGDKDLFFVKTGKWQGLVSVTDSRMALELAF